MTYELTLELKEEVANLWLQLNESKRNTTTRKD